MSLTWKLVDWVDSYARSLMLLGMVLGGVGAQSDSVPVFTAWSAMWLGTCGACFRQWKTESGLWMLSSLMLVITLPVFVILAYGSIMIIIPGHGMNLLGCDSLAAIIFLSVQSAFLLTVTRTNWSLAKKAAFNDF